MALFKAGISAALRLGVGSGRSSSVGRILGRPGRLRSAGSSLLDGVHSLIIVAVEDATLHDGPAVRGSLASLRVILELGNAVTDRLGGDVYS